MNNNYNSNTVVKQDFAVVKQVDGRAAHMTDTTRHQSWQSTPPPLRDHAGSIPASESLGLIGMKLPEKYKENFERPSLETYPCIFLVVVSLYQSETFLLLPLPTLAQT